MSTQPTSIILGPRYGAMADEPSASDLQHVIGKVMAILSQRRWLFVIPLLGGMAISLAVSLTLPRRYILSTIFERRDDVVLTKLISANSPYSFGTLRRSLWINLMGYQALGAAVDELSLTQDLPRDGKGELTPAGRAKKQQLITGLSNCLELNSLEKSDFLDLIEVRYKGDDPELGVKLVTKLSENYMRNTREWISQVLARAKEFFVGEAEKRQGLAAKKEAELLQMAVAHPGITPSDPDLLSQRLMATNLAIEEATIRRNEAFSKLKSLKEYLENLDQPGNAPVRSPGSTANGQPNPRRLHLQQEMDRVKAEIADAKALRQMTDNHPHVMGLREKLEQLRVAYEQLPETVAAVAGGDLAESGTNDAVARERRRVEAEMKALQESEVRFDAVLAKHKTQQAQLEEAKGMLFERRQAYLMRQEELQNLKADLRIWEGHVDTVSRVLTAEEGKRGIGFATVEAARQPRKPVSPTLGGVFLLSAGIGLALGAAAVFLREIFDRTLRDPAKVRQSLGIPVLETIGEIRVGPRPGWFDRGMLLPAAAGVEALAIAALGIVVFLSIERPDLYEQLTGGGIRVDRLMDLFGT